MSSGRVGDDGPWFWQHVGFCQGFKLTLSAFFFFLVYLFQISNIVCLSFLSASVRPHISSEQEDFIRRVIEIPLDKRKCWDLITLDTLHAYYGGSEPTQEACRLNAYSRWRKSPTLTLSFFPLAWLRPSLVLIILYLPFCRNGGS